MQYELYIDILFLENLVLDYMLLRLVSAVLPCTTTRGRLLLAAAAGSLGLCLLYSTSLVWTVWGVLAAYVGLSALMVKLGLRIRDWKVFGQAEALLYLMGLLLGGIITWLKGAISFPFWPFGCAAALGLGMEYAAVKWLFSFRNKRTVMCRVTLGFRGREWELEGLWDTGNRLYDPLHQKPVSLVERRLLEPEISREELVFAIPYHSVGRASGMLAAVLADYICIRQEQREYRIERPVLGLTEEPIASDGSVHLILNPRLTDNWRRNHGN